MKKVFLALFMIPLLVSAQESQVTIEFENGDSATALIQDYVKALQNADVNAMNSKLAENVMIYGLGGGQDSLNLKQHGDYYTESISNYKHSISRDLYLPVKVTNNWNEGEWVLAWGLNTITNKESSIEIPVPYHTASQVVNGKITRIFYYYDMLNIMESQGFKLTQEE
ncbi:nuclear transport factor 2 family protein [Flagellimonas sp. CMM7]|uniref:nuclear transport factor 2 family protein n=1 Tax=Flagellimonas sp. CMM7 TaxID=2654676 RepID=UPI0013CF9B2C|nr:nuclear transport factor 2 family protein [Flagellimonas sp. CMM7]UII79066.1 hypothetical protein LV704_15575 [Flagellimonas sp. CMM7]